MNDREPTALDRFRAKVLIDPTGCLLWTAAMTGGYGQIKVDGRNRRAHRWYFERVEGSIPEGLVLDHVCRVRHCVNPDHLRVVTNRENLLAPGSMSPSAVEAARTHCPRDHSLTGGNLLPARMRDGKRRCRACSRAVALAAERRRRGQKAWTEDAIQAYADRSYAQIVTAFDSGIGPMCHAGHALTPENTYRRPRTGGRRCRACRDASRRRYRNRLAGTS